MSDTYRVSALGSAAVRMWRAWSVIVPAIAANAIAQALLALPAYTYGSLAVPLTAVGSALALLVAYGIVIAAALEATEGPVAWSRTWTRVRTHGLRYAIWAGLLALVAIVGFAIFTVPGVIVLALTPFLLPAALDGANNPLRANFDTIRRRFWRWLVTVVIAGALLVVAIIAAGFTTFFARGALAALIVWVIGGLLIAWLTVAWTLIYRDARAA
jgi:hypothetical protein